MTLEEFEDGIDCWGGAIETWPAPERNAAQALLAANPAAVQLLEQARGLDLLFAVEAVPSPPSVAAILCRTIMQNPSLWERVREALGLDAMRLSWLHAGGLAACLVVGVVVGAAMPRRDSALPGLLDFAVGSQAGPDAAAEVGDE